MAAPDGIGRRPVQCIVKLGALRMQISGNCCGAAVTRKGEFETLNEDVLSLTARQMCEAAGLSSSNKMTMDWSRSHGERNAAAPDEFPSSSSLEMKGFVVVHGAGSYGHFQASRAKVNKGPLSLPFVKAGFVATRISVTKLNLDIVRAFAREGVPAVSFSPFCAGWTTANKDFILQDSTSVKQAINGGFLPILHGDAVLDKGQGSAILSGDLIVRQLAAALTPGYVVFLTNVAGVYDRPPSESDATLLKEIAVEDGAWVIVDPPSKSGTKVETNVAEHDTTGGMATKIAEAASIAANGISVLIVEAGTSHALEALKGAPLRKRDSWVGTVIRRARPGEIAS